MESILDHLASAKEREADARASFRRLMNQQPATRTQDDDEPVTVCNCGGWRNFNEHGTGCPAN